MNDGGQVALSSRLRKTVGECVELLRRRNLGGVSLVDGLEKTVENILRQKLSLRTVGHAEVGINAYALGVGSEYIGAECVNGAYLCAREHIQLSLELLIVGALFDSRLYCGGNSLAQLTYRSTRVGNDKHFFYIYRVFFIEYRADNTLGESSRLTRACRSRYEQGSVSRLDSL